jgi:flagellar hook assembly protein FlgD/outer membrane protein OmpA-like peptidoglycan-associated protein
MNYINLTNFDESGIGHAANAGLSYPTRYGVFTGALHFLSTDGLNSDVLDFGTLGSLDISFSKEIYKNLFTGFGISGSYGSEDWGAGLNLGIIHKAGTLGILNNFVWGASLRGLGRGYGSAGNYMEAVPENLTLNLSAGFDMISRDNFVWNINGTVGFPTFTDLRMELGQEIRIQENLRITTSSSFIASDMAEGNYMTLIPSVGVYYNLPLGGGSKGKSKLQSNEMELQAAGAPLYDGVAAFGAGVTVPFGVRDSQPPEVGYDYDDTIFLSPDLNGVQDELNLAYTAEDERYIMGYNFSVYNEEGDLVREYRNKDERPENESFKNIFDRMFSAKTGATLPETFRWDGVMESGEVAPDGNYTIRMSFWDDNENRSTSERMKIVLDTVTPEVTLDKPSGADLIFSPDGDGNKDELKFKQDGSREGLWSAAIINQSGDTVKTLEWKDENPASFSWDGTDDAGVIVPDGLYSYRIESTDPSGNFTEDDLNNILVNTEQPEVALAIDSAWLSPGNSEGADLINFTPDLSVTSGIVEWELQVQDMKGRSFWSFNNRRQGILEIPKQLGYGGEAGVNGTITEGKYRGYLTVVYQNGYHPEVYSPVFTVDTTAPVGVVSGGDILSPDGDGFKDALVLSLETSDEDYWEGFIRNAGNEVVKSYFWRGTADPELRWEGRDQDGRPVPDGRYSFHLEAFDKAGNRGFSRPHAFTLDTREMSVQLTVSEDAFSPDGNGIKDEVRFYTAVDNPAGLESWTWEILGDADDDVVFNRSGEGALPESFVWKGEGASGTVSDGNYRGRLSLVYLKGDRPEAYSGSLTKDTSAPVLTISSERTLFSPDGDGMGDSVTIRQSASPESEYSAEIRDERGTPIRSWFWRETLEDQVWDGKDENGNVVDDGTYSYHLMSSDAAGNSTERILSGLRVDTKPTSVYLTAENSLFSPLSETYSSQNFKVHLSNAEGVESWNMSIKDAAGNPVHSFSGPSPVPEELSWDGRDRDGKLLEGSFAAEMAVVYTKGNRPVGQSRDFIVDNSAPLVDVGLGPVPFSPDDDNVDDELKIALNVRDLSPVRDWEMIIRDPRGREFIRFGGKGRPSERIIWDGRSRQGELVQSAEDYPFEIRVTDYLGHSTLEKGNIPVDILVIREGGRLKVRISNITFKPYKADLVTDGEQGAKNQEVLKRLSQVLKKYGSYRILIEGHAVSEYYDNAARAAREEKEELQPLSLARATTVRATLSDLGIQNSRMDVDGKGGTEPIVPHSDLDNRWKNRRVEFVLIK